VTTIVLLPGMDGSGTLFDDFVSALDANALVIAYPKDRALGYDDLESLVRAQLPKDEPYVLLGESFSGPIAISIAAGKPQSLRAVVLVCTFARLRRSRAFRPLHRLLACFPFWRLPASMSASVLLGRFDSASLRAKLSAAVEGVSSSVWRARLRSVLDVDVTSQLQRIEIPILYLQASEDRILPAAVCELISRAHAGVRTVTVEGPHALLQSNPGGCAREIRQFARDANAPLTGKRGISFSHLT
jgi:pimeloyl-[acyl-carrier protein] methyl ester esterase